METEKILLQVEFNSPEIAAAIDNIQKSREEIDKLKQSNKELSEQGKKNSTQYIQNEESIKKLNTEVSSNSRIVQANTQAQLANVNSIDALKKANSDLLKERNSLNTSNEFGAKRIAEINALIDKNNEVINQNSSALEKQRLNVGNYTKSIVEAYKEIEELKEKNDKLILAQKKVDTSTEEGKRAFDQLNIAIQQNITQINIYEKETSKADQANAKFSDSLDKLAPGVKGTIEGFKGMTSAALKFIATPLGLVLAAIAATVAIVAGAFSFMTDSLSKTEAGTNKLNKMMAVFSGVLNALTKALRPLAEFIFDNVVKAFDVLSATAEKTIEIVSSGLKLLGFDEAAKSVDNFSTSLKGAIKDAQALVEAEALLAKQQREARIIQLQFQKDAEKLRQIRDDEAKGFAARIEANEALGKVLEEQLKAELAIAKQALVVADARIKAEGESAEALDQRAEALTNIVDIEERITGQFSEQLANRNSLLKEQAEIEKAAREKREAEILKAAETERQALFKLSEFRQQEAINAEKNIDERVKKEIALAKFQTDFALEDAELVANDKLLIQEDSEAQVNEITKKGIEDRKVLQDEQIADLYEGIQEKLDAELQSAQASLDIEVNALKEKVLAGTLSKEEYDTELMDMEIALQEASLAIKEQYGEQDLTLAGQITDAKIAKKQYEKDTEIALEQAKFNGIKSILTQSGSLLNKNSLAYKALAIAQASINTYQAASLALASFPPPFGAIAAALTVIQGLVQVKNIASTNVPKMARGGVIDIGGRDHAQGGEDVAIGGRVVANVQGGEKMVVLKRGVSSSLLRSLAGINEKAGGVNFFRDQSPKSFLADGGFVARSTASQVNSNGSMTDMFLDGISKIQIVTRISDIERVQNQKNKATQVSSLQ